MASSANPAAASRGDLLIPPAWKAVRIPPSRRADSGGAVGEQLEQGPGDHPKHQGDSHHHDRKPAHRRRHLGPSRRRAGSLDLDGAVKYITTMTRR